MANEVQIKVSVTGAEQAKVQLNNISKSFKDAGNQISSAGKKIFATSAAVTTGIVALVDKAGKFQSVQDAFSTMSKGIGVDGDKIVSNIKEATSNTITEMDIMTNFLQASTLIGQEALGENGDNFTRMSIIAKKAARATGQDVDFMMESIVSGIGRSSKVLLDNTGIVIDVIAAQEKYAQSIGKTRSELTAAEEKIATTNAFLEEAEKKYKDVAVSAGGVSSSFAEMKVVLSEAAIKIGNELIPAIQPIIEELIPIIVSLAEKFSNLSPGMKKAIVIGLALGLAIGGLLMILGPIVTAIGGIIAVLGSPFLGVAAAAIAIVLAFVAQILILRNTFNKLKEKFQEVWPSLKSVMQSALDKIKEMPAKFKQIGINIILGLIGGISSKIAEARQKVVDLGNSIKNGIKNALRISSPSKVFEDIGNNIVQGLNVGVENGGLEKNPLLGNLNNQVMPQANGMQSRGDSTLMEIKNILAQMLNQQRAGVNFNGDVSFGGNKGLEQQKQSFTSLLLQSV